MGTPTAIFNFPIAHEDAKVWAVSKDRWRAFSKAVSHFGMAPRLF